MRILLVTQYFWPETFPITKLVRALRDDGSAVTVLTGQPNYPEGVTFRGYSALQVREELHPDGFTIYRVPVIPRARASALRLAGNYLTFVLSAGVLGPWLLRRKKFDVVFVYAPSPIVQALPAILLARLKNVPVVTWVQDLWPDSLESTGHVRNPIILAMVERLVRWIYRRNDLLLGQSPSFVTSISRMSGTVPVEYFPQPGDADLAATALSAEPRLQLGEGFNVVFAGNLGRAQALDSIVDAAEILRNEKGIRFVLVGSGSRSEWLRGEISRRGLTNVELPGRFAQGEMPPILAQASALLVSLVKSPSTTLTIPSKLQAYLAAGRPILAALDGEGSRIVRDAGAGLPTPAQDPVALAEAVLKLRSAPEAERIEMGKSARRYFEQHFSAASLARQLNGRLAELASTRPPG